MARLEIELKFSAPDDAPARVAALGASPKGQQREEDHYFNAPDRDFAATNEALRIRRINAESTLTYKGPRQPGPAKTRNEIEVPLRAGDATFEAAASLLSSLGYRPVAVVTKQRRLWSLSRSGFDLSISLDEVDGVGRFIEVEIVADELQKADAQALLIVVTRDMGLTEAEHRSYLTMLLQKRAS